MKPRGNDPMRPSTPPPADSWWTRRDAQQSRDVFYALDKREAERMNQVQPSYNLPQKREKGSHD